ncbi:MAG TPA: FG-GAP repeat protein, partial [Streptosporangiaceae bacterium]|nr:FG-GAP repeat protein [Streptosporangiaceae bacterium]
IAVSGSTIVVGAPDANILPFNFGEGAAYVFVEPRSGWADATQTAKLTHSDGGNATVFGISVGISGDTVVAGAGLATVGANFDQGAAYIFVRPGSGWADETQTAKLTASDGAAGDQFGTSVAISGNTAVAGAPGATASGNFLQGAA